MDLAVLAKTPRLNRYFQKNLSSNAKAMALTRAPETEGENQDISQETTFTLSLAGHIDMFFFPVFLFVICGFCLLFG